MATGSEVTVRSPPPRRAAAPGLARQIRLSLANGRATTVYIAAYDLASTRPRVVVLPGLQPLEAWCAAHGVQEALTGGFFVRPDGVALGEVRTAGVVRRHVPFDPRWTDSRGCLHLAAGDNPKIAPRHDLPAAPGGDLLQAGPMLVRNGRQCFDPAADAEGFSAGAHQFDSDITDGRHPRAAAGIAGRWLLAVVCDGRAADESGLTLDELATLMVELGCDAALNLDGGGSTSMVSGGRLRNRPHGAVNEPIAGGRPISTGVVFLPRA